ncbi:MAG: helix-turn-helix transcriptional regulator, partial [Oscillospiraceae bacterium]
IDDVAQSLGISVGHIGKLIYKEMDCHFSDYLNYYRIEYAKEMLKKTTMKVYEVSYNTGYNNVEHFTRVFKKIVGMTPLAYANKNN